MKCKTLEKKVDMILDKALSKEAEEAVMKEIDGNPDFEQVLNNERNFRNFVRGNVVRPKVTPEFIESIKEKVKFNH